VTTPDSPCIPWEAWAPPLDPPTTGGLPVDQAQCIADATAGMDPHLTAALMWEAYAATLPPTPYVVSVQTGAQAVQYAGRGGLPAPTGDYGLALQRAEWHRSFLVGEIVSVPLVVTPPCVPVPVDWWQRNLEHPP
jgi:hypothetical protein